MTDDIEPAMEDERETELSSLAAIFPELIRDSNDTFSATIEVPVTSTRPFLIGAGRVTTSATVESTLKDRSPPTPPESDEEQIPDRPSQTSASRSLGRTHDRSSLLSLHHLPPLRLHCLLPSGYPDEKPPLFTIQTTPAWLPHASSQRLIEDGYKCWEDLGRSPMLFDFIDQLQRAAETVFDLVNTDGTLGVNLGPDLVTSLGEFDRHTKQKLFDQGTYECGICLSPKKGLSCYRLPHCNHVFCVRCLQDFYSSCIIEGDVASVKCLDPDCTKTTGADDGRRTSDCALTLSELRGIPLNEDVVERYVILKRKLQLEADGNVIYCPRKWCQGPARWTSSSQSGETVRRWRDGDPVDQIPPPSERVAICEECSYAFCRVCLAGWHGELASCWPRRPAELDAEEQASANYLRAHSSPCPTCAAPCQKTMGCNHMICSRCKTHFCYLCSAWLDDANAYRHFNTFGGTCYQKLWVLEGGDGDDVAADNPRILPPHAHDGDEGDEGDNEDVDDGGHRGEEHQGDHHEAIVDLPALQFPVAVFPERRRPGQAAAAQADAGNGHGRQRPVYQDEANHGPHGLRRFLLLAVHDEEDEWDSDELDGEEHGGEVDRDWEIPVR